MNKTIKTKHSTLTFDSDGILHVMNHQGCHLDIAALRENIEAVKDTLPREDVLILVNMKGTHSISREAREYLASEQSHIRIAATAVIIDSAVSRIIANFFIGFHKPSLPFRLFNTEADARKWLKGHLE